MTRFEIIVEVNGQRRYLDTQDVENISLNYSLADIAEIDKRNASYSKTIKVPETRNNRSIFGDIADLSVDLTFNANKRTKAWVLVDTLIVLDGYIQLKNVDFDIKNDVCLYDCVIYADNDNFFKLIGDSFITDLDFSELDHIWNRASIVASWTASWTHGYYYPLIDYGYNWDFTDVVSIGVQVKQMFPATNAKYIWQKIFDNAGFRYESNFLNSKVFENLYIPFNRDKIKRPTGTDFNFSIRVAAPANILTTQAPNPLNAVQPDIIEVLQPNGNFVIVPRSEPYIIGNFRIPFDLETPPNGDPAGQWNPATFEFTAISDALAMRFVVDFDITFRWEPQDWLYTTQNPNGVFGPAGSYVTGIQFYRTFDAFGVAIPGGVPIPVQGITSRIPFHPDSIPSLTYLYSTSMGSPGIKRVRGQIATDLLDGSTVLTYPLRAGEKVWVEVRYGLENRYLRSLYGANNLIPPVVFVAGGPFNTALPQNLLYAIVGVSSRIFNVLADNIIPNEVIPYNAATPFNLKQKDFILSIIKMFNLYVEPSKTERNLLYIEPRDDYYQNQDIIKDWTYKLDINQVLQEEILGEVQNTQLTFKYKDDKDFYNEDYKNANNGINYGEFRYFIDNDFIKGEKKIEPIFSPTPIVGLSPTTYPYKPMVIPVIAKVQNNSASFTDHNWRILTRVVPVNDIPWNYYTFSSISGLNGQDPEFSLLIDNVKLIGTSSHGFSVGDYVQITQNDGGVALPLMGQIVPIINIPDPLSIVITTNFNDVNTGTIIGGVVQPLYGRLRAQHGWSFDGVSIGTYPYLGHLNNPYYPRWDFNYGQTTGFYYQGGKASTNNLFNVYWRNLIDELNDKNSKIITAYFYLTAADIADFKFSDKIYIRNQYYRVNKIVGYNPTKEALTKVELIKVKSLNVGTNYLSIPTNTGLDQNDLEVITEVERIQLNNPGSISSSTSNKVDGNSNLTIGKNNSIFDAQTLVNGSNNTITGRNNIVFGNNNTIQNGSTNVILFGDGQTVEESNIVKITNNFAITPNRIDAGRDEVLNMYFTSKPINYISASFDTVREFGSQDPVNFISGGRDVV